MRQVWESFHAQIPIDEEAERESAEKEKLPLDEAVRVLQKSERGRQGRQRAMFMTEISKQEERSKAKGLEVGKQRLVFYNGWMPNWAHF